MHSSYSGLNKLSMRTQGSKQSDRVIQRMQKSFQIGEHEAKEQKIAIEQIREIYQIQMFQHNQCCAYQNIIKKQFNHNTSWNRVISHLKDLKAGKKNNTHLKDPLKVTNNLNPEQQPEDSLEIYDQDSLDLQNQKVTQLRQGYQEPLNFRIDCPQQLKPNVFKHQTCKPTKPKIGTSLSHKRTKQTKTKTSKVSMESYFKRVKSVTKKARINIIKLLVNQIIKTSQQNSFHFQIYQPKQVIFQIDTANTVKAVSFNNLIIQKNDLKHLFIYDSKKEKDCQKSSLNKESNQQKICQNMAKNKQKLWNTALLIDFIIHGQVYFKRLCDLKRFNGEYSLKDRSYAQFESLLKRSVSNNEQVMSLSQLRGQILKIVI